MIRSILDLRPLLLGSMVVAGVLAFAVTSSIAANLSCPPDCTGTSGSDTINGNGNNNTIKGRGGPDTLFGRAGHDGAQGDGGVDAIGDNTGNDVLRGSIGAGDELLAVPDSGRDELYGGAHLGDKCFYDVSTGNDYVDSTCEKAFPY